MELNIFIGLPASGKSSFYYKNFSTTHLRINLDMLRTRIREAAIFQAGLRSGQRMVVDNTNPSIDDRVKYLMQAKEFHFACTAYYFDVPFDVCSSRNNTRRGREKVPDKGLKAIASKLTVPTFAEGFKKIYYVDQSGEFVEPKR